MLDYRTDTFLAICKFSNFTKAAEYLHITQPAVSQHIKFLEKEYGHKLFEYKGKKIILTPSGEQLFKALTTMKSDLLILKEQLTNTENDKLDISIGVTMTIGEFLISSKFKNLLEQYPNANFHLTIANTSELFKKLSSNEIQFALIEGSFSADNYDSMFHSRQRFIPIANAHHKYTTPIYCTKDLLGETLLVREVGSGSREILEEHLHIQNLSVNDFNHYIEINGVHTIKSMVEEDYGIAFLYETAVAAEIKSGKLIEIPLDDFKIYHDFSFIWAKNSIYNDNYRIMCESLI